VTPPAEIRPPRHHRPLALGPGGEIEAATSKKRGPSTDSPKPIAPDRGQRAMSEERRSEPGLEATGDVAERGRPRRFQTGIRGLIVTVACCGVISWSARRFWESGHPAIAASRGLASPDPADRIRAARELTDAGATDPALAVPPLIAALDDPDMAVRIAIIEALGAIGGEAARGGSAGDAVQAAWAGLFRPLTDREPAVRAAAIVALMRITVSAGVSVPIDRQAAVDAIAAGLRDGDDRVRLAALLALPICGWSCPVAPPAALIAFMERSSAGDRARAIRALAGFRRSLDPWLPFLLRGLQSEDPEVVADCWAVFARERPPAFSAAAILALVAAMGDRARIVRTRAARALDPHAKDPRAAVAIPALLALLKEPIDLDSDGLKGSPRGVSSASDFGGWDPAPVAARVLGRLAPGTASAGPVIAALAEVVRSGHPFQRQSAIEALGEFGPAAEPAVPTLLEALRREVASQGRPSHLNGFYAARALGRIAPQTRSADEALAVLIEALDSRSEVALLVRGAVINELPAFGARAAVAIPRLRALRGDRAVGPAARWALQAFERMSPERTEDERP
jgi:HEAT repeat protein